MAGRRAPEHVIGNRAVREAAEVQCPSGTVDHAADQVVLDDPVAGYGLPHVIAIAIEARCAIAGVSGQIAVQ